MKPLGISPLTQGAPFYRGTWVPTLGCQTCNIIKSKKESDYKEYNSIKSTKKHIPHGYKVFLVNKIRKRFLESSIKSMDRVTVGAVFSL